MNPLFLLALLSFTGLLIASSSKPTPTGLPQKVPEPLPPSSTTPTQQSAPPVLENGTLGHTGQPAGLFWGLPMDFIWKIDNAYYAGDPFALNTVADQLSKLPGFDGLAGIVRTDAKRISQQIITKG